MILLSINSKKCAGCGFCMNCNSNLFGINEKDHTAGLKQKGKLVTALSARLSLKELKEVKEIIKDCPTQAIKIYGKK